MELALVILYFGLLAILSVYGVHRLWIVWLLRRRPRMAERRISDERPAPRVTVQLPVYNERYVAERLIRAVAAMRYPADRFEVQVLDDSTDDTADVVQRVVAELRAEGKDVLHLRRPSREGFKAGALAFGLESARGELVAVFDADFIPSPDFLERTVAQFDDPEVGMVQVRWDHVNRDYSTLTRAQAILLDGHFVVEHAARHGSGRFFNFNGTAGIWRRAAIDDAGGWQHDTLTEDLDLSYRAQYRGWRFVYLDEVAVPAELPVDMAAFKSQQHRWAKGSIQTARKLLPRLLRSRLPWRVKLEAVAHMTANVGYVLMVLLSLLVVPSVWMRGDASPWLIFAVDLPIFTLSSLSVAAFYVTAQRMATGSWRGTLRRVPFLMAVGIGLSINNSRAVLEALAGRQSEFRRTPKYNLRDGERPKHRRYRGSINPDTAIELALALYFTAAIGATAARGLWGAVPFLMLFAVGYGYTAVSTLWQAALRRGENTARPDPALASGARD